MRLLSGRRSAPDWSPSQLIKVTTQTHCLSLGRYSYKRRRLLCERENFFPLFVSQALILAKILFWKKVRESKRIWRNTVLQKVFKINENFSIQFSGDLQIFIASNPRFYAKFHIDDENNGDDHLDDMVKKLVGRRLHGDRKFPKSSATYSLPHAPFPAPHRPSGFLHLEILAKFCFSLLSFSSQLLRQSIRTISRLPIQLRIHATNNTMQSTSLAKCQRHSDSLATWIVWWWWWC